MKKFSLHIGKGERVAIVGRTGAGKSTIAQLLLRMYDPDEGMILYDGVPMKKIDPAYLRSQVSYVPQDVFLFSDSVSNNIRFGLDDSSQANVVNAAKMASVHNEIEKFPLKYETQIGERGV